MSVVMLYMYAIYYGTNKDTQLDGWMDGSCFAAVMWGKQSQAKPRRILREGGESFICLQGYPCDLHKTGDKYLDILSPNTFSHHSTN